MDNKTDIKFFSRKDSQVLDKINLDRLNRYLYDQICSFYAYSGLIQKEIIGLIGMEKIEDYMQAMEAFQNSILEVIKDVEKEKKKESFKLIEGDGVD